LACSVVKGLIYPSQALRSYRKELRDFLRKL